MKKEYIEPKVKVVNISKRCNILCASVPMLEGSYRGGKADDDSSVDPDEWIDQ